MNEYKILANSQHYLLVKSLNLDVHWNIVSQRAGMSMT